MLSSMTTFSNIWEKLGQFDLSVSESSFINSTPEPELSFCPAEQQKNSYIFPCEAILKFSKNHQDYTDCSVISVCILL